MFSTRLDLIDGIDLEALVEKRTSGMMQDHLKPKIEKGDTQAIPGWHRRVRL